MNALRVDPVNRIVAAERAARRVRPPAPRVEEAPAAITPHMPDGTPAPHCMTPEQVCAFLQLDGEPCLRRLDRIRAAGLRSRAVGDATRFLLPDVLRFLADRDPPIRRGGHHRTLRLHSHP